MIATYCNSCCPVVCPTCKLQSVRVALSIFFLHNPETKCENRKMLGKGDRRIEKEDLNHKKSPKKEKRNDTRNVKAQV